MSMDFALEIDWGSKSEQEFQDGSVSAMSVVLASPRRTAPRNALLCRVGRCPVRDCTRPLVSSKRTRFEADRPDGVRVKVWICLGCNIRHLRAAEVRRGKKTRRNRVKRHHMAILDMLVWLVKML